MCINVLNNVLNKCIELPFDNARGVQGIGEQHPSDDDAQEDRQHPNEAAGAVLASSLRRADR